MRHQATKGRMVYVWVLAISALLSLSVAPSSRLPIGPRELRRISYLDEAEAEALPTKRAHTAAVKYVPAADSLVPAKPRQKGERRGGATRRDSLDSVRGAVHVTLTALGETHIEDITAPHRGAPSDAATDRAVTWLFENPFNPDTGQRHSAPDAIKKFSADTTRQNVNQRVKALKADAEVRGIAARAAGELATGDGLKLAHLSSKQVVKNKGVAKKLRAQERAQKQADLRNSAFVAATLAYDARVDGESAAQITDRINAEYKAKGLRVSNFIKEKNVRRWTKQGKAGTVPVRGRHGKIPDCIYAAAAFQCQINQAAGSESKLKDVRSQIEKTLRANNLEVPTTQTINAQLTNKHPELLPVAGKKVEETRWEWQDKQLYSEWFDGWKCFLIENGYADDVKQYDDKNKLISEVTFRPGKLACILNLDETQIPRDGCSRAANHVSNNVMVNFLLPRPGSKSTKCSGHETLILCISASGEVLPPFVIFGTSAEIVDNRKVNTDNLQNLPDVLGYYGSEELLRCNTDFAVTDKGSMDKTLWPQYIKKTIYQCFPATAAEYKEKGFVSENRICIKCDDGPGKKDIFMLLELHELGIDLFPGFPNGSGYNQECDDVYTDLKLAMYAQADAMESAYNRPLTARDVGEIINGLERPSEDGNFPNSDVPMPKKPMESVLTHGRVLKGFAHVGAAPLTRESLNDKRLRIRGDAESGTPAQQELARVVAAHAVAVAQMRNAGFHPNVVEATKVAKVSSRLVDRPVVAALPEDQLVARLLKAKSKSAGNSFIAVGAVSMNGRVALRTEFEKIMAVAEAKKATEDKKRAERQAAREEAATIMAAAPQPFKFADLNNDNMAKVLRGRGVSGSLGKKVDMIEKWTTDLEGGTRELPEVYPEIIVADGYTYEHAALLRRHILRATERKEKLDAERAAAVAAPANVAVAPVAPVAAAQRSPFASPPTVQTRRSPGAQHPTLVLRPNCSPVRAHRPRRDTPTRRIVDPQHPDAEPTWLVGAGAI
jgi:hypothetical protein